MSSLSIGHWCCGGGCSLVSSGIDYLNGFVCLMERFSGKTVFVRGLQGFLGILAPRHLGGSICSFGGGGYVY